MSSKVNNGRKRVLDNGKAPNNSKKRKVARAKAQELSSDEEDFFQNTSDAGSVAEENGEADPFENETVDEKRARLAKEYLSKLADLHRDEDDEVDEEAVVTKLREEAVEATTGKRPHRKASDQLLITPGSEYPVRQHRGHQLAVTCVAITDDEKTVFSGSKDCCIIKYDVETNTRLFTFKGGRDKPEFGGHTNQVYSIAVSSDGRFLASGGMDNKIRIWDAQNNKLLDTFSGHRDFITGLSFRFGSHQLFSASNDRTVKVWNCDDMAYIDTLYGHQSPITAVDSLTRERCVTSSSDKTVRVWKVVEETQMVFRAEAGLDTLSLVNEEFFVSGGDDGGIQYWTASKKKPVTVFPMAHDLESPGVPNWITSVSAVKYSDVFASGSNNGVIKLWKFDNDSKKIVNLTNIPCAGFINSLAFSRTGRLLVAGVGQEHRFGRWKTDKKAKNAVKIFTLPISTQSK
jgi:ribosomal RNA-processing protein 9